MWVNGFPPHLGNVEEAGRRGTFLLLRKPSKDSGCPWGNHPDLQEQDATCETQSLEISTENRRDVDQGAAAGSRRKWRFITTAVCSLITLTAKLDVGGSTDNGAAAVDGQTLVGACISSGLRAADHQAACHQGVSWVHAQRDLCAVQQPPVGKGVDVSGWRVTTFNTLYHSRRTVLFFWPLTLHLYYFALSLLISREAVAEHFSYILINPF